ncbi:soluble lytic murein transglycosylase-like protein [Alkalibacillus filiformis]|uniref:Soluble lytic murein transglycosylase-like protein n=1 Tax=Alkalibacillus filiformis TaxID=200990 RepID=A0ABU0DX75_9BACI|nr:lytic transglycosylase domain-containing protein [Alkalibacillus filiformis]MDQ0352871.1 soluble lytic murein transglycosylase-like protein [Alkalibacillus filiformis]
MIDSRMLEVLMNYRRSVQNTPLLNDNQKQELSGASFETLFMDQLGLNNNLATHFASGESEQGVQSSMQVAPDLNNDDSSFNDIIEDVASRYNIDTDLIRSVIQVESGFNPQAVSHAGAQGLMQLMPATAESLGVQNVFDPAQNIEGGARYLRDMLDRYNGDSELALAAYNAGPGNVDYYGGVPPFEETQNYVKRILG